MSRIVHTNIWSAYGYAKQAGYEGTEEEFEEGLKKGAEAAENAEASAESAAESAEAASASKDVAVASASAAAISEGNALTYATNAAGSASDAAAVVQTVNAKATEAAQSAARAETFAGTASTKASAASSSATEAAASASSAASSASNSANSATAAGTAQTAAEAAQTAAETAQGKAEDAQTAAETAQAAAEAAQAAAEAVEESIPSDYSELSDDVADLKNNLGNFLVYLTLTSESGGYTSVTIGEIVEAFNAGKRVIMQGELEGASVIVTVAGVSTIEPSPGYTLYSLEAHGIQNLSGGDNVVITVMMNWGTGDSISFFLYQDNLTTKSAENVTYDNTSSYSLGTAGNALKGLETDLNTLGNTVATATADITGLNKAISEVGEVIGTDTTSLIGQYTTFYFWDITKNPVEKTSTSSAYTAFDAIAVTPGNKYSIYGRQGGSNKQVMLVFVDANYTIVGTVAGSNSEWKTIETYAPADAAYALITSPYTSAANLSEERFDEVQYKELVHESDIEALESSVENLNALNYKTIPITGLTITSGKYWNSETSVASQASATGFYAVEPIAVKVGETYIVSASMGSTIKGRMWVLTDDQYNIKAMEETTAGQGKVTKTFTVPDNLGITKLLVSGRTNYPEIYRKDAIISLLDRPLLKDKTVAIIGDSISTNGNTGTYANVAEIEIAEADVGVTLSAYLTANDVSAGLSLGGHTYLESEIGTEVTFVPVAADVGKKIGLPENYNPNSRITWWEVAMDELGFNPIPVCWSGASITSHEKASDDYKASWAWHDAQIRKCGIRTPGAMTRTAPDVIFVYRGTNDFSHTSYATLTEDYFDNVNWQYPTDDELQSSFGFYEGYSLLIKKLRNTYPNAKIFLCTLNVFKRVNYSHFPTNNGINTLPQYNDAIRRIANFFGCGLIEFDKCGITFENCYSEGYITDSSTKPTHPSDKGHRAMGRKAIADIKAQYSDLT